MGYRSEVGLAIKANALAHIIDLDCAGHAHKLVYDEWTFGN
jgi:hypothetical protein